MFRGLAAVKIDAKGRMNVPSRYRDRLMQDCAGKMVATIDTDAQCLLLYPQPEWEIIERKLEALPSFNHAARRIQRLLIGHATDMEIDAVGRLLIPPLLREYAQLDKRGIMVGQGRKFELWDEANWQRAREGWLTEETRAELGGDLPDEVKILSL